MSDRIVLALGYFDCVHIAHRAVLTAAAKLAKDINAKSGAITFLNNIKNSPFIYTHHERILLMQEYCEEIIAFNFDANFSNQNHNDFLSQISSKYNVCGLVCGYDYKYGKNAEGNTVTLLNFCKKNNIAIKIVNNYYSMGASVSSTFIKQLLAYGDIEKANRLLQVPYHISGQVIHGRGEGHLFGFPTANIAYDSGKTMLKSGVYSTMCDIEGHRYKSVTNIGAKPTFNDMTISIESFIENFSGDLYNKNITIYFYKRLRDIKKFDYVSELKNQILIDIGR